MRAPAVDDERWTAGSRGRRAISSKAIDLQRARTAFSEGKPVIVVDDLRTGHGYLALAAELATTEIVALMVERTTGFVRVAIDEAAASRMRLPAMSRESDDEHEVFAVTVDSAHGHGTGISASDRGETIRLLGASSSGPSDFTRPGHVLPVIAADAVTPASPAQVLLRLGALAGCSPAVAYAELVAEGTCGELAGPVQVSIMASQLRIPSVNASVIAHAG